MSADELLRKAVHGDGPLPLTEAQLARKTSKEVPFGLELPELPATQSAIEDLLFLSRNTPLTDTMRRAFELWVAGGTVRSMAAELGVSPATAARILKAALIRCWEEGPVTFGAFSARSIYRPPADPPRGYRSGARCEVCAAPLWNDYERETCGSPACDEVLRVRRRLDRRRFGRSSRKRS